MKHRLLYIPIALLMLLSFVECAKKGSPSGGSRDTIPPMVMRSSPENYSINFKENEIDIRFDEYIKLKDINSQLIISPPMKYKPIITPLSTSKNLKIKLIDTLKPNTTYSFNFGNAIVDNNEENILEQYKYLLSTGTYIDSLQLSGRVRDARRISPEAATTLMLYEVNDTFQDSIVYLEKPTYITITTDTTGVFTFENLKEGKYLLTALKEKTKDYIFRPKDDKIGFVDAYVTIPTDSVYNIFVFKEEADYKIARPSQVGKNHILFGYEGNANNIDIEVLSEKSSDFKQTFFKDEKKDTLHYWFKPSVTVDSLLFKVSNGKYVDTLTVRMRDLFKDSLNIEAVKTGTLKLKDSFKLKSNIPLVSFDTEKFRVMNADSVIIASELILNQKTNSLALFFPKTEDQTYNVRLLPGALTDFFERTNDTLHYKVNTRMMSDYGTLDLSLKNADRFPIIIELVDDNYNIIAEDYLTEERKIFFDEIKPGKYFLRIIYDDNKNGKWDSGNYLRKVQPEKVIYYPAKLDVRANWSLNEIFQLKK